jgi:phage tail sheath gpL-like
MASVTVTISGLAKGYNDFGAKNDSAKQVASNIDGIIWGALQGVLANSSPKIHVSYSSADAVLASGTLTISSGSGSVGGTIGGTAKTVTWATSDTASAAALVTAINADTTINKLVIATSAAGVVTLTALVPGAVGNKITLVASGTGVTASGATLASGAGADTNGYALTTLG